ncbi:MAG: O-antigen ligase family protein [Prevotellaceae bacterium]|nr:O-antigen ligase family protein [Prevotellaceae bacterium]
MKKSLIILLCVSSVFVYSHLFTDPYILPKWFASLATVSIVTVYITMMLLMRKRISVGIIEHYTVFVSVCFVQACYGIAQYYNLFHPLSIFKVSGSFDNPAGYAACLITGIPFVAALWTAAHYRYLRLLLAVTFLSIIIAIILSRSRTGIVSITFLFVLYLFMNIKSSIVRTLAICFFIVVMAGSYCLKKDSANGRLLIWRCGLEMAQDKLWFGHGAGGFEAHYMDYQARYLAGHPDSPYAKLADNVKYPFNEYLAILINYGIVGIFILFMIVAGLTYCYKRNPKRTKIPAAYTLIGLGIFSFFSYPFTYPFTWVVALFCVYVIIYPIFAVSSFSNWLRYVGCLIMLVGSTLFVYKLCMRIYSEYCWGTAYQQISVGKMHDGILEYCRLEQELTMNPYYLYNYASILYMQKYYKESLRIAQMCRQYWADYDLELLIGDNYASLHNSSAADYYYKAANMCPSKFLPLVKLHDYYKDTEQWSKANEMAQMIIKKNMKIKTAEIMWIKEQMRKEMLPK